MSFDRLPPATVRGVTDEPRPYGEPQRFPDENVKRESAPASKLTEIVVGGGAIPESLDDDYGFGANAVIVDNYSSQWVHLQTLHGFVPLFTIGRVVVLDGSQRIRAKFDTPPNVTALGSVNGQFARLFWTQEHLAESTGVFLGSVIGGAGPGGATTRIPADTLAEVLALVVEADLTGWSGTARDRIRTASATGASAGTIGALANAVHVWAGTGYNPVFASNQIGDASALSNSFPVNVYEYNGASNDRRRTPLVFKNLSALAIAAEATIWTPTAGKKFRLMGALLTQGVIGGAVTLRDNTAGATILIIPPNTVGVAIALPTLGNGILSAVANNVLTAQGVATETLTGVVFGTEE